MPKTRRTIHQRTLQEQPFGSGRRVELEFHAEGSPRIPATLVLPHAAAGPAPGALLIHGYGSRREHMVDGAGRLLLERGIASLAIDLPLHGSRADPLQKQAAQNPLHIIRQWRLALAETRLAVGFLRARPEIDGARTAVVGYSLGSYLATIVAAEQIAIRAVVVAAGGDLPSNTPFSTLARTVADPLRAVRRLGGRPLLIVHGRHDRTARPDQAQRLYDAAGEPREIRWWDAGHRLPDAAIGDAAAWLDERLR
jgi:uncharacterized protein